jgi:hypothetical protein
MDMAPAARETVLEAYGQGPSNYVLNYVEERVGDRWAPGRLGGSTMASSAQFSALFEGLDWKRVDAPSETRAPMKLVSGVEITTVFTN